MRNAIVNLSKTASVFGVGIVGFLVGAAFASMAGTEITYSLSNGQVVTFYGNPEDCRMAARGLSDGHRVTTKAPWGATFGIDAVTCGGTWSILK